MAIGPFTTYAPPGVYTQTIVEPVLAQLLGGLRVPVLIGTGRETLSQSNFEMIRGSSSLADTPIFNEDVSGQWVVGGTSQNPTLGNQDGSRIQFRVRNYPIVDGSGINQVTFDVTKISVAVNGDATVVSQINGTTGIVTLLTPPTATDVVTVSYFFRRKDTRATDNVSNQVTDTSAALVAPKAENYTIVSGSTDTIQVFVNDANVVSTVTLTSGTRSATDIANDINGAGIPGLTAVVYIDNQGLNHLQLVAQGNILIGGGNANGVLGYNPGDTTGRNKSFRVFNGPIVDGSDGGITTTETSKVTVLVNNLQVIPAGVDGTNRLVTLAQAPVPGSTVTISYWFNTWQDTFDYLPNSNITSMSNVGIAPGRRDFLNGPDFIVVNDGDQSKILWGTAWQVVAGETTGTATFDSTQVVGQLVDDRLYGVECSRYVDTVTNTVSSIKFELPEKPTTGNGRDTPLGQTLYNSISNGRIDLPSNRPDLIMVYVGKDFRDAFSRPAVRVLEVSSADNTFVLAEAVPADNKAFSTFWYNRIVDDIYTLTVATPGASGIGKYRITSQLQNNANLYSIRFGTKSALPQTVQWPSGVEFVTDAFHFGGKPVSETVTVTFNSALLPAKHASFSNSNAEPYDIFNYTRQFGNVQIDGGSAFAVNLNSAFAAQLLSNPIASPTALAFLATDRLVLEIDGIILAAVDVSALTTVAAVATAINAAVDADTQIHADGSGTFFSTAANAVASVVTYGTESILKIKGRSVLSATNSLISNVKVRTPTTAGQTDASPKLGLNPNQESTGDWNALNHPARLVGTLAGAFNVQTGLTDAFYWSIDGQDYTASLPAGSAISTTEVVNTLNASYAATAPATDQAVLLAQAIVVANELRTDYNTGANNHIGDAPSTYHALTDVVNTIAAPAATTLASLLTLLNEIKTDFNNHISNTGGVFHTVADTVNTVTQANATDLQSAMSLAYYIKSAYNAHLSQPTVHALDDATNVITASNSEYIAAVGQGQYLGRVVLKSQVNSVDSGVTVGSGTANALLGFSTGDQTSRVQPTASKIAAALNADSTFNSQAAAFAVSTQGRGTFLSVNSLTAGVGSIVSFSTLANTAFVASTGLGTLPGDGDIGEDAKSGFAITSSNPDGSSGVGIPGQTYTDARTGLRFSILSAESGDYASSGSFTLVVNSTFTTDGSVPTKTIPGLEATVFNTLNMGVGTTALLTTFDKNGAEPSVGDVYYVSYQYAKTDLDTSLFRDLRSIQQNFGSPTPENPISLAARLALLNGSVLVGLKQVLREPNSSQASLQSYAEAIDEQRRPIEGSVKPDVIVPLSTDTQVFSLVNQHSVFMSSPRQEGERVGIIGVAAGTTPLGARAIAQGLQSELMMLSYPDTYVVTVQDDLGNTVDQLVDASYMAAAMSGTATNPSIDVATPWTRRQIAGFKKLGRVLDPTEANQTAVSGVNIIEQVDAGLRIRHGLTTRIDNVITRTPSVTLTIHFVQQSMRRTLDPYIGQKFTGALLKAIENAMTGMFSSLIDQQIVTTVSGIVATVDEFDPTILRTSVIYVPVFPLEYIVSTLNIRIRG